MDRRELIQLFGIASAFPVAVASRTRADYLSVSKPHVDQLYQLVYAFDRAVLDFRFLGIYTKLEDAEAHAARLKAENPTTTESKIIGGVASSSSSRFTCIGVMPNAPHDYLVTALTDARMGQLAETLKRLEQSLGSS